MVEFCTAAERGLLKGLFDHAEIHCLEKLNLAKDKMHTYVQKLSPMMHWMALSKIFLLGVILSCLSVQVICVACPSLPALQILC